MLTASSIAYDLSERLAASPSVEERLITLRASITGRIGFSSSLGLEDQVILHAIRATSTDVDVFSLDTGRHFPETLETVAASEDRYGARIRMVSPVAADLEALVARDGVLGFRSSIGARKACCDVRKVKPLERALAVSLAWVTGLPLLAGSVPVRRADRRLGR